MPQLNVDFKEFGQRVTLCLYSGKFYGHKISDDYSQDQLTCLGYNNQNRGVIFQTILSYLLKHHYLYAILVNFLVRITLMVRFNYSYRLANYFKDFKPNYSISLNAALEFFIKAEQLLTTSKINRDCLPRSLSLYIFLKSYGFDVKHNIGVAIHPFYSHAWVELDNHRILDQPNLNNSLKIICRI